MRKLSIALLITMIMTVFGAPNLYASTEGETESDLSDEEKEEKKQDPIGTCYGQNGDFNTEVYNDNCILLNTVVWRIL